MSLPEAQSNNPTHRYRCLLRRGRGAVVLGCTEIPLIMNDANSPLPTLDSTRLLALAALSRAVRGASDNEA